MKKIILPDFIIVPYQLISDDEISLTDERLYGIIYWFARLKLEKCTASNSTLAKLVKTTPKTIQWSLERLEKKGYIQRIFSNEVSKNRVEIIPLVVFTKVSVTADRGYQQEPIGVSASTDSPLPASPDQNKNIYKKNIKEEELNLCEQSSREENQVNGVIKMFEIVNPSYEKMYPNKTQRSAAARLLKKWTLPQIQAVVNILPKLNADQYAKGKSITPLQLEDNLGYIKAFIDKNNSRTIKSV